MDLLTSGGFGALFHGILPGLFLLYGCWKNRTGDRLMNLFPQAETDLVSPRHTNEFEKEWHRYRGRFLQLLKRHVPQRIVEYAPRTGYGMGRVLEGVDVRRFQPSLDILLIESNHDCRDMLRDSRVAFF
jgi:hypothetical protein